MRVAQAQVGKALDFVGSSINELMLSLKYFFPFFFLFFFEIILKKCSHLINMNKLKILMKYNIVQQPTLCKNFKAKNVK